MAGYIGKSQGVTQVDGYNRTEADDRYVNASGDTISGQLGVGATDLNSNKVVIEGGNAGQHSSNLKLTTGAGTNGLVSDLSFYATFVAPTSDTGPRRTADITSGYATDNWGNEYLAIGVGGATDVANVTTERFRIDGAGRVTMPYQPFFKATGSLGGVAFSTSQAIPYDTVYNNVGNCYNSATSTFVAPVSGLYQFYASYLTYPNADTSYSTLLFSVNGSTTYDRGFRRDTKASQADRNVSSVIHLNTNDTVKVWLELINTTSVYNHAGHGHFSGYLIG